MDRRGVREEGGEKEKERVNEWRGMDGVRDLVCVGERVSLGGRDESVGEEKSSLLP